MMIFTQKQAREQIAQLESRVSELEQSLEEAAAAAELHASEIKERDESIAVQSARIQELEEAAAAAKSESEELAAKTEELAEVIEAKDEEIVEAKESAAKEAVEMLAAIGQEKPLEPGVDESGAVDHVKVMANLKGAERTKYYNEHKAEIRKALK